MRIEVRSPERPADDYTISEHGVSGLIRNHNNERVSTHEFSEDEVRVILGRDKYRKFIKENVCDFIVSRSRLDLIRGSRLPMSRKDDILLSKL